MLVHSFLFCYFFFGADDFNEDVFLGLFLFSRCLRSGFPVESAILYGPGLSAILFNFNRLQIFVI